MRGFNPEKTKAGNVIREPPPAMEFMAPPIIPAINR